MTDNGDDSRIDRLEAALGEHQEILVAYLFGSAARGTSGPGSDLDVAVLLRDPRPSTLRYRARLAEELTRACDVAVDVVLLADASPALAGRILQEGDLLLSRDESARVRFETEALRRYFDTARLRQELNRELVSSLRRPRSDG